MWFTAKCTNIKCGYSTVRYKQIDGNSEPLVCTLYNVYHLKRLTDWTNECKWYSWAHKHILNCCDFANTNQFGYFLLSCLLWLQRFKCGRCKIGIVCVHCARAVNEMTKQQIYKTKHVFYIFLFINWIIIRSTW